MLRFGPISTWFDHQSPKSYPCSRFYLPSAHCSVLLCRWSKSESPSRLAMGCTSPQGPMGSVLRMVVPGLLLMLLEALRAEAHVIRVPLTSRVSPKSGRGSRCPLICKGGLSAPPSAFYGGFWVYIRCVCLHSAWLGQRTRRLGSCGVLRPCGCVARRWPVVTTRRRTAPAPASPRAQSRSTPWG